MPIAKVSDFRSRVQKEITLRSGLTVKIRKLTPAEFVTLGKLPLLVANIAQGDETKAREIAERHPEESIRMEWEIVAAGMIEPRVTTDPAKADENTLHILELGDDLDEIFTAILEFANIGVKGDPRPFSPSTGQPS